MSTLYLLIITSIGILLTFAISKSLSLLERVAVGVGLGLLIISVVFYFFMANNIFPFENISVVYTILFLLIISIIIGGTRLLKTVKKTNIKKLMLEIVKNKNWLLVLMSASFIIGAVIFSVTSFWPITEWDALTLYDMRARFFHDGLSFKDVSILDSYDTFNSGYYFSYPPLTSLIHASFYSLGLLSPQVIYPFLFFSLVVFLYKSLESSIGKVNAAFYSLVLLTVPSLVFHAIVPYTNLIYTYYYFISSILLARYFSSNKSDQGLLLLSGLMLAGGSWSRFVEPFYLVNIFVFIYFLIKKRQKFLNLLIFIIPLISIRYLWSRTVSEFTQGAFILKDIDKKLLSKISYSNFLKIFQNTALVIGNFIYDNLLVFGIFVLLLILLWGNYKKQKKRFFEMKIVLIVFILDLLLIVAGTFTLGLIFPDRPEIFDSIGRLGILIFPFIIYLVAESKEVNIESILAPKD